MLHPNQQQYIRANHRRSSISEMARFLKTDADDIIEFMGQSKLATTNPSRAEYVPKNPYRRNNLTTDFNKSTNPF
jgi:hypothetical protein